MMPDVKSKSLDPMIKIFVPRSCKISRKTIPQRDRNTKEEERKQHDIEEGKWMQA